MARTDVDPVTSQYRYSSEKNVTGPVLLQIVLSFHCSEVFSTQFIVESKVRTVVIEVNGIYV